MYTNIIHNDDICNYSLKNKQIIFNSLGNCRECRMKGNTVLLVIIAILLGGTLYLSYTNFQQIQVLRQENTNLWVKIDSVQQICSKKPVKQSTAPVAKPATTGSAFIDYLIQLGEEERKHPIKDNLYY